MGVTIIVTHHTGRRILRHKSCVSHSHIVIAIISSSLIVVIIVIIVIIVVVIIIVAIFCICLFPHSPSILLRAHSPLYYSLLLFSHPSQSFAIRNPLLSHFSVILISFAPCFSLASHSLYHKFIMYNIAYSYYMWICFCDAQLLCNMFTENSGIVLLNINEATRFGRPQAFASLFGRVYHSSLSTVVTCHHLKHLCQIECWTLEL